MLTQEEKTKVANALIGYMGAQSSVKASEVATRLQLPVAFVEEVMRNDFHLSASLGGHYSWTRQQRELVEAHVTHHRDAKTGQYVTKDYAERNPNTTVSEEDAFQRKAQEALAVYRGGPSVRSQIWKAAQMSDQVEFDRLIDALT
jgi:hypothetical protein